ncbi:MAG: hypothetical protein OXF78_11670 [Rhodospirillales bacterium]|nr:hypothetical protein [Rhodospirillales bacterium]
MAEIVRLVEGDSLSALSWRVRLTRNAVKYWLRHGTIHLDLLLLASSCVGLKPVNLCGTEDPVGKLRLSRRQRSGAGPRGNS